MSEKQIVPGARLLVGRADLQGLLDAIGKAGYQAIGPTVADDAVVYEPIQKVEDLPVGLKDEQSGGKYRLVPGSDGALFEYVVGPHTWKRWLFPPRQKMFSASRNPKGFEIQANDEPTPAYALIGVRPCELAALAIHDKVFDNGDFADPGYLSKRKAALIVAVNCARAGDTCFCASMNTGPKADAGFDLALTELQFGKSHDFLVEVGSQAGAKIMDGVKCRPATDAELKAAAKLSETAAKNMGREMVEGVEQLLKSNLEHPRWNQVAERCLNCANCTMVCPTCFCSTMEDVTDLGGDNADRWRLWDSCFTLDFSYIHGGAIRREGYARYRQWMTHKLAHWHDQFDTSGCTGCGRCITWCPVGIDITEEARAIRDSQGGK